jgi:hypothetical protein
VVWSFLFPNDWILPVTLPQFSASSYLFLDLELLHINEKPVNAK